MKKILFILLALLPFMAVAESGWIYTEYGAGIDSDYEYVTGDYDSPTILRLMLSKDAKGRNVLIFVLKGECQIHSFRKNQQYVKVEFGMFDVDKWRIKEVDYQGWHCQAFLIVNVDQFIRKLKKAEYFSVTLPLYEHGTQTFFFNADGYPLDW